MRFLRELFVFRSILQKNVQKMKNPELKFYSLSFKLCFDMRDISRYTIHFNKPTFGKKLKTEKNAVKVLKKLTKEYP